MRRAPTFSPSTDTKGTLLRPITVTELALSAMKAATSIPTHKKDRIMSLWRCRYILYSSLLKITLKFLCRPTDSDNLKLVLPAIICTQHTISNDGGQIKEALSVLMLCMSINHWWPFLYHTSSVLMFCPFSYEKSWYKLRKVY